MQITPFTSARIIPQFFYDILGRITPGIFIIMMCLIAIWGLPYKGTTLYYSFKWFMKHSVLGTLLISGASFLLGHLVSPLGNGLNRILKISRLAINRVSYHLFKPVRDTDKNKPAYDGITTFYIEQLQCEEKEIEIHMQELENITENNLLNYIILLFKGQNSNTRNLLSKPRFLNRKTFYYWVDQVRMHIADAGLRHAKMRAEMNMHLNIAAGGIIITAVETIGIIITLPPEHQLQLHDVSFIPVGLAAFLLGILAYKETVRRFYWGVINHYHALYEFEQKSLQTELEKSTKLTENN